MKQFSLILIIVAAILWRTAYSQEIEANVPGIERQKVKVYFSPKIKICSSCSYFGLKIDSISRAGFNQQIWKVNVLLHIKTNDTGFYVSKPFLYPLNSGFDTTINGKLVGYEIQSVELSPSGQLEELIAQIRIVDSFIQAFPQCYNELDLKRLHSAFNQIIFSPSDTEKLNEVYDWLSDKLAELGQKFIAKDCPSAGISLLYKALIYNPFNSLANYSLAKLYYLNGQYFESYARLKSASQKITPACYKQLIALSTDLAKKFIDLGLNTMDLVKPYQYFCMADTLRSLFTLDLQGFDRKFKKIIEQYFDYQAKKLLSPGNSLDLDTVLNQFLSLARLYKSYEQYLDEQKLQVLDKIFNLLLDRINGFIAQGNYEPGLKYLNRLSEIDQFLTKNSYSTKLKHSKYQGHLLYANYLLGRDSLPQAKRQLQIAQKLFFDDYSFDNTGNLELLRKQGNDLIIIELTLIDRYTRKNQYDSALSSLDWLKKRDFSLLNQKKLDSLKNVIISGYAVFMLDTLKHPQALNKIEKFILKHHLTGNQSIWTKYLQKLELLDQNCKNEHLKFFKIFKIADSLIQNREFLQAKDTMEQFLARSQNCFINSDTIEKFIQYYRFPIIYQKLTQEYYNYLNHKNYPLAYRTLMASVLYFYNKHLGNYGFKPPDLYKMINQQDTAYIRFAIYRLTQDDSLDLALKLLQTLHKRHLPAKQVKILQAQLGYKLALYDFLIWPQQKPWHSLKKHLPRPRLWYMTLIRAYFKQRKKMKGFKF